MALMASGRSPDGARSAKSGNFAPAFCFASYGLQTFADYAWLAASWPSAAWAAASRAIGTRNGEQET